MNDIAGVAQRSAATWLVRCLHPEHAVEPGFGPGTPVAMRSGRGWFEVLHVGGFESCGELVSEKVTLTSGV
jgi:hypothetical protein